VSRTPTLASGAWGADTAAYAHLEFVINLLCGWKVFVTHKFVTSSKLCYQSSGIRTFGVRDKYIMCHGHLHSFGMPYHMQFKFASNNLVAHTYTRLPNVGRRCTATRTRTRACTRVQTRVHTNTYARTHTHTRTHTHRRVQPHFENMGDVLSGTRNIFVTNYRFVTNCT